MKRLLMAVSILSILSGNIYCADVILPVTIVSDHVARYVTMMAVKYPKINGETTK